MTSSTGTRSVDIVVEHGRSNVRRRTKPEYSCAISKAKVDQKVHDWTAYLLHNLEHINDERQSSSKYGENHYQTNVGNY